MADYPPYQVTFRKAVLPIDPAARDLPDQGLTVRGPHTFNLSASASKVQVALTHNNDETDVAPNLIVTFTDVE